MLILERVLEVIDFWQRLIVDIVDIVIFLMRNKKMTKKFWEGRRRRQLQTYLFRIYNICGNGGYPYSCEIYCGKTDDTSSSLGKRIVHNRLSLVQDAAIFEFFDNLYTSHSLITELSERHMRVCGTNRENRTNKCPLTESKVLKETK